VNLTYLLRLYHIHQLTSCKRRSECFRVPVRIQTHGPWNGSFALSNRNSVYIGPLRILEAQILFSNDDVESAMARMSVHLCQPGPKTGPLDPSLLLLMACAKAHFSRELSHGVIGPLCGTSADSCPVKNQPHSGDRAPYPCPIKRSKSSRIINRSVPKRWQNGKLAKFL
jgi:hypothetical protein